MAINKVWTIVGVRGAGKTPFIIGGDFEQGMAAQWLKKGMSTLIIDEVDHPKYRHVPILLPKNYDKLDTTPGIYRTLAALQDMQALVEKIGREKLVWNSLVVCEDAKKYIPDRFTKSITAFVGNSKQQNTEIVFMFWEWATIPPDVVRCTNMYVVMNTEDTPENNANISAGLLPKLMKANQMVMSGKNKYIIVDRGI